MIKPPNLGVSLYEVHEFYWIDLIVSMTLEATKTAFSQENFIVIVWLIPEAVTQRWSVKKIFLKLSKNLQKDACAECLFY